MSLQQRAYAGPSDHNAMVDLVHSYPAENLHVVDLPYRFSSWAFDEPSNIRLWTDVAGRVAAWAILQTPFWSLDYAYRPDVGDEVHADLLAWADGRASAAVDTAYGRPAWFVSVFASQKERQRALERSGFASQAKVGADSWSKVLLRRVPAQPLLQPQLPPGFSLRPLAGAAEVAAYVDLHRAVFESENMTVAWRARTLRHPDYRPDLDLVAVAPDGRLAAFCVGWFTPTGLGSPSGQIEPMGVHADFRHLGLGRAILSQALRRLEGCGVTSTLVETDSYRNAAFELYEAVGFRVVQDVLVYRKDYAAAPG